MISIRKTNYAIQSIVIYPVDSVIHLLKNWGRNTGNYCGSPLTRTINTISLITDPTFKSFIFSKLELRYRVAEVFGVPIFVISQWSAKIGSRKKKYCKHFSAIEFYVTENIIYNHRQKCWEGCLFLPPPAPGPMLIKTLMFVRVIVLWYPNIE